MQRAVDEFFEQDHAPYTADVFVERCAEKRMRSLFDVVALRERMNTEIREEEKNGKVIGHRNTLSARLSEALLM